MRGVRAAGSFAAVWLLVASAAAQGAGGPNDALGWGAPAASPASDAPDDGVDVEVDAGASDAIGFGDDVTTPPPAPVADEPEAPEASEAGPAEESDLALGGTLRLDTSLWTERFGDNAFAKARTSVDVWLRRRLPNGRLVLGLHGEYDLAYRYRRDQYDRPTIDTYEQLLRAGESYVALERPRATLALGAQIVVFGHADMLSVVDIVNPHDLREAILTDLMDLRVPVLMSRVAVAGQRVGFEIVIVHEGWFELVPPPFGTWSPVRRPILEDPRVRATSLPDLLPSKQVYWDHAQPRIGIDSQQVFGRITARAGAVDLAVYGAVYRDPIGTVTLPAPQVLLENEVIDVRLDHLRVQTLAASMSYVVGSVVGWAELAVDVRRPVNVEAETNFVATERRTLFRWNAGLRHQGAHNGVLALEYAQGTQEGPGGTDATLLVPPLPTTLVVRGDRAFARDALRIRVAGAMTGEQLRGGVIALGELAWQPRDGLTLGVGYAVFAPWRREASLIWGYTRHDRLIVRLRYDFAR